MRVIKKRTFKYPAEGDLYIDHSLEKFNTLHHFKENFCAGFGCLKMVTSLKLIGTMQLFDQSNCISLKILFKGALLCFAHWLEQYPRPLNFAQSDEG